MGTNVPVLSFPRVHTARTAEYDGLLEHIDPLLVNGDDDECNKNLSVFLKVAVDYLETETEVYTMCLVLALRFLHLNLFVKNVRLCIGKILSLLQVLSEPPCAGHERSAVQLKEFLSIIVLLVLKLNTDLGSILDTLRDLQFFQVLGDFIASHVHQIGSLHSSYVLLKFTCDSVFQYLYHVVLLSDAEFEHLTSSNLVPVLIEHLLANDNFNHYGLSGSDFADESKLVAYEEFKLLLLINEQYIMKAYSRHQAGNRVFEGLLNTGKESVNGICGFTNLLMYHINREELRILKILMMKFLYIVFTTSYTANLPYVNDLKILVDIVLRELNDLDYASETSEDYVLALTYLKVLYPILMFSQLLKMQPKYKLGEIVETLRNIVFNCDPPSDDESSVGSHEPNSIVRNALKILAIPWLKKGHLRLNRSTNSSSESLSSVLSLGLRLGALKMQPLQTPSTDSFTLSHVASVRALSKSDFNRHTENHNLQLRDDTMFAANNHNIFQSEQDATDTAMLLDLPTEYLQKPESTLQAKARRKKAPPPPPPPSRRRR